jgi:hypothetical protein
MERSMSAIELSEWMAYASVEPFGDIRADLRAGIIAREIRVMLSSGKKKYSPLDFMPIVKKEIDESQRHDAAQLAARINAMMFEQSRGRVIINYRKQA